MHKSAQRAWLVCFWLGSRRRVSLGLFQGSGSRWLTSSRKAPPACKNKPGRIRMTRIRLVGGGIKVGACYSIGFHLSPFLSGPSPHSPLRWSTAAQSLSASEVSGRNKFPVPLGLRELVETWTPNSCLHKYKPLSASGTNHLLWLPSALTSCRRDHAPLPLLLRPGHILEVPKMAHCTVCVSVSYSSWCLRWLEIRGGNMFTLLSWNCKSLVNITPIKKSNKAPGLGEQG